MLSQDDGKVKQLKKLELKGKIIVIGDGYTDYRMKEKGGADLFIAFTENIKREKVIAVADKSISNFKELIEFTFS